MEVHFELHGLSFVWDNAKAAVNPREHDGITFEQAATVFFDPFFRMVDASRHGESRDAVIGLNAVGRLLFVVHIERDGEFIRLISARKATSQERTDHDS